MVIREEVQVLSRVCDLKGAFISFCPKQNGMPLGRTAFQDFEIAYFLNNAYDKLVRSKTDALTQQLAKTGEMSAARVEAENRNVPIGQILSELGRLYRPTIATPELDGAGLIGEREHKLWGPFSRIFEVPKFNGCTPYVIGADLHEVAIVDDGDPNFEEASRDPAWSFTFPIRFISGADEFRYALMLRSAGDMDNVPYRFARMRTIIVRDLADLAGNILNKIKEGVSKLFQQGHMDDDLAEFMSDLQGFQQLFIVELLHRNSLNIKSKLEVTLQMVVHPSVITEAELTNNSTREIEVAFGYEIAELAAQTAMATLSMAGQQPQPEA